MSAMGEAERAAEYEAEGPDHEDANWGEPERVKPRRRLNSMISVRLSPEEAETVRRAAEDEDMTVSAYLRSAALSRANGPAPATATWRLNVGVATRKDVHWRARPEGVEELEALGETSADEAGLVYLSSAAIVRF